jgi:hypothetical protein
MKKCPSCYAILKEMAMSAQVPNLQHKASEGTPGFSSTIMRYECTQCGHVEEEFQKPAPGPNY